MYSTLNKMQSTAAIMTYHHENFNCIIKSGVCSLHVLYAIYYWHNIISMDFSKEIQIE